MAKEDRNTRQEDAIVSLNSEGVPRIGGWLRLLTLGMILMILNGLGEFSQAAIHLQEIGPDGYAVVGSLLWFEVLGSASIIVLGGGLLYLLLKKRVSFVKWYIGAMVSVHLFNIADLAWLRSLVFLVPDEMMLMVGRIAAGITASCIWVWYLLVSRRVKQTLIK